MNTEETITVRPFLDIIRENCAKLGDKACLIFDPEDGEKGVVTYRELEDNLGRVMHLLTSLGVQSGDRVAIQLPKSLEFVYLHLAVMRLGAISLPLNPGYPQRELAYFINDAEAKVFFLDKTLAGELDALQAQAPSLSKTIVLDVADGEGEEVHGYIFSSENLDLDELDAFEGEEYKRVITQVKTKDGKVIDAFIYTLQDNSLEEMQQQNG